MADAVVSVVVEQITTILMEQISKEVDLVRGVDQKVLDLSQQLQNVRNVLEDAEEKRFKKKNVRDWLVRLEGASYEMEDVLDEWHTALRKFRIQQQQTNDAAPKDKVCSFVSCLCFEKVVVRSDIAKKIENVKAKLDLILAEKDRYGLVTSSPSTTVDPSSWRPQSISLVELAEVHGRDIDRDVVASKIFMTAEIETEPERQLEIVSIVGAGGVGKTTLAQLIFNDRRVKDCFELAIWICVSDPFDVANIAKVIVESVTGRSPDTNSLEVLVQVHLKACILGKKILLVLDDVWTEDHTKWEPLKISLKSGCAIGSKILVTTRNEMVAKTLDTLEGGIHRLGVLSDDSCWLLLKRIALFGRDEEECAKYKDIGMKIVAKCRGLPLAAKTLGSLLRCKNNLKGWENVFNSEIWEMEEAKVDIFPHLLLSYNELSPALKRCFSFCAVFPKDFKIEVDRVIEHWMALGYLGSDIEGGSDDMELRGKQYFDNLAMRSLFQDFTKDDSGEQIKYFQLHDIVHDFAQFLRKNDTVVVEARNNKMTSCQACSPQLVSQVKEYRSLLTWNSEHSRVCSCLSSLRVLKLEYNSRIPHGIKKFIHLRWLDLDGIKSNVLDIICNELYNLQTLLLNNCNFEKIPREIGNLIRLRRLDLHGNLTLKELPREIGNLINLRHLDLSWNKSLNEVPMEIGNLINLRYLNLSENTSLTELPKEIGNLINLRHLNLSENKSLKELPKEIGNLINLGHIYLNRNESLKELPREIGNLINLRHLDLNRNESLKELPREIGNLINLIHVDLSLTRSLKELPMEIGNLINLRHLDLSDNNCVRELPREIGNLINLRHLNLSGNKHLEELPENICGLRELETLDIFCCFKLSRLPQGIHGLVNLKHLRNMGTYSTLRQYPQGIAKLTCLRTLDEFQAGRDMGKLGWLKNLNWLGGSLRLSISLTAGSGNTYVEDAREGELRNKEYLEGLRIEFDYKIDIGVEDRVWVDVLDALQPHPNLQDLKIICFHGSRLPGWIASPLNQVKKIYLGFFSHLSSMLLPLGKLPYLEELEIEKMNELQVVGREFLGITKQTETIHVNNNNNVVYFPNLKKLTFNYCPKWEEWEDITAQEEEDDDEKVISFMPRLTQLNITNCNSLKALPHRLLTLSLEMKKLDISGSTQLEQRYGDEEGYSPSKSLSNINPRIQLIINPHDFSSS